jgi:hypothetical protein
MAQLSSLTVTSSFDWNATTENTSSAGYMWFDNGTFKISRNAGVWSTGPNMICGRAGPGGLKGSESQNAALSFGGAVPGNRTNLTEEYDGSSWSAGGVLPLGIGFVGGAGTQNAALQAGGETPSSPTFRTETSEYDGSSWSAGGSLINGRGRGAAAGFQNSGITWGGRNPSIDLFMTCTEEYDGSSWSTGGALGSGGRYQAGTGTQNATLSAGGMFCGDPSYRYSLTFEYNGTSWSSGNCQIHRRIYVGSLGGNQNEAVLAKGRIGPNSTSLTEGWDGIAWSSQNTANLAAQFPSGTGSSSGLIVYGNGNCTTATESYTPQLHAKSL